MTYTVHFTQIMSVSVTVEADDYEAAIEQAYEDGPSGLCAQCSGWGKSWTRDDGYGDDTLEPDAVVDAKSGREVWVAPDQWQRVQGGAAAGPVQPCVAESGVGFLCTEPAGHVGAHIARQASRTLATWPQDGAA